MIPGLRVNVIADVANATHPIARVFAPAGTGHVALNLDWKDDKPVVQWLASSGPNDPFARLLRDMSAQEDGEAWKSAAEAGAEPMTSTAVVQALLPVALRWLSQPIRRADAMVTWLRTVLLSPQEVH